MEGAGISLAFSQLQPLCVAVVRSPTGENIAALQRALEENAKSLSQDGLQDLQEYLLFPIRFNLKKSCRENLVIGLLRLHKQVLERTRVTTLPLFENLYMELLNTISDPKCGIRDVTEDLKLQAVENILTLISRCEPSILEAVYSEEFKLPLSQGVYILVKFIENESLRKLRVGAMETLAVLAGGPESLARERFLHFLPGVSLALTKVLRDHHTQVQWVLTKALDVWAQVVCLVIPDKMIDTYKEEKVKDISSKLKILISSIVKLVTFSHWKVRLALLKWSQRLLKDCFLVLQDSIVLLMNVALALSSDDMDSVRNESLKMIREFEAVHLKKCEILEKFREEIARAVTELPRNIKRSTSDTDIHRELAMINGYFVLLGQNMGDLYAEKLVSALVVLVEQDVSGLTLLHSQPSTVDPTSPLQHLKWPTKTFKHFRDEDKIRDLFDALCANIATSNAIYCAIDYLLLETASKPHAILVVNQIVGHLPPGDYVSSMMEDYLAMDPDIHQDQEKPRQSKENILKKCLVLEGMAKVAGVCQKEFRGHLLRCLFLIVESVGSPYSQVSHAAYVALCSIALSCGYSTLSELINDNMDYLINAISLKLRHHSHKTAMVLNALLRLSSSNILVLVEDLVNDMLRELDGYHMDKSIAINYLSVLFTVVECIHKWYPKEKQILLGNTPQQDTFQKLIANYVERRRMKELQDRMVGEEDNTKELEEEGSKCEEEDGGKKKKPLYIEVTLEIMRRCIHLQHDSVQELSLLALDTVGVGSRVLDTDSLLPMAHKLWAPLVRRFSSPNPVIWRRAWAILTHDLAPAAGDFLAKRVMAEVWPQVEAFLRKQAGTRNQATSNSLAYKLTLEILQGLPTLATALDLQELQLEKLCKATALYLCPDQPTALYQAALQSAEGLGTLDPDLAWYMMNTT